MFDLVERTSALGTVRRILVRDYLFDLSGPVYYSGFKSLKQVFILGSCFRIAQIFVRNVESSSALGCMTSFSQGSHELVELGHELLLYSLRPVFLA